jgi:heme oxygenase
MHPQHAEEIDAGLAARLKDGTKDAHKEAETVNFVREFIKGKVPREIYAQLVVNLYHVYGALEEALEANADHELVDPIHFPDELERAQTLKKDAEFFCGPDWESEMQPSPVTLEYVQRIREVARDNPELVVPHAYTRYLGDLSGGQVLRKAAVRGLKLPDDGSGVCFYIFKRVRDMKVFKNMYRARLDALEASKTVVDSMVEEANRAFDFNTRIFRELDALGGFVADPSPPAPPSAAQELQPEVAKKLANCPFAALAAQGIPMPAEHPPLDPHDADDVPAVPKCTTKDVADNTQRRGGMALMLTASAVVIIAWLSAQFWQGEP